MRLPDITTMVNNIQRNTVPEQDKQIVCSAIIDYHKKMNALCATKRDLTVEYDSVENPTNKVLFKYLDRINKDDLLELAIILGKSVSVEETRENIIKTIKGE